MPIGPGCVVALELVLRAPDGRVLEESEPGHVTLYLHGASHMLPGLERALVGLRPGDVASGVLAPADAYGPARAGRVHRITRFAFPRDAELEPGTHFLVDDEGELRDFWVARVEGETVFAATHHPYAGLEVTYDARVVSVRAASDEELDHGHPFGM